VPPVMCDQVVCSGTVIKRVLKSEPSISILQCLTTTTIKELKRTRVECSLGGELLIKQKSYTNPGSVAAV
jgi:hypothetical protein